MYSIARGDSPFQQDTGAQKIVSIEAEHYHGNTPAAGHQWQSSAGAIYAGGIAMKALPDDRTYLGAGYSTTSPRLDYQVEFVATGTVYVWVRGLGPSTSADSLYVGMDGSEISTGENFNGFLPTGTLVWSGKSGTSVRKLNVTSTGVHTINVWMRESGMVFDKLVLTTDPAYVPTGSGPAESSNGSQIPIPVVGAFRQDSGSKKIVSMEAESYHDSTAASDGHEWQPASSSAYSGNGAMEALPEDKLGYYTGYATTSARLDYSVEFVATGTHYIWVRGLGPSTSSDSLHVGIDGATVSTGENFNGFLPTGTLAWSGKSGTSVRKLSVATPGIHTINVWMRESGMVIDKLVLTTDPAYVPTGAGPAESATSGLSAVATPTISPNGGTFTGSVTVSLATATSGAEIFYTLDGTDPTEGSSFYSAPFVLTGSAVIKAAAFLAGYNPSPVSNANFIIGNPPPVLNPIGGKTGVEGQRISFTVTASDPDDSTPSLSADLTDLPPDATFIDYGDGTGIFSWTPGDGDAANSPYAVTFIATDAANPQLTDSETVLIDVNAVNIYYPFKQDSGSKKIVSLEAEHFSGSVPANVHEWLPTSGSIYSGGGAMQALPEDKLGYYTGYATTSARLDYAVEFVATGTHYIWVRGLGPSTSSDSLHVGIDGAEVGTGENFNGFLPTGQLVWSGKSGTSRRKLSVTTPGVHTINVWMRESGMVFDKLVLTTDSAYVPTGAGPAESPTNGSFFDDFGTDTTSGYTVTNTLTTGGVGDFVYDPQGRRSKVLTGQNIGLKFSKDLANLTSGAFKIEFLPAVAYGSGGTFSLRLKETDTNFYEIYNSSGSGTGFIRKVIAGREVGKILLPNAYSQAKDYHLLVNFTPQSTRFLAFGKSLTINTDTTAIVVNKFEVELKQQDGIFDNIEFTETPFDYYVAAGDSITRGSHDDITADGIGYEPVLSNLLVGIKGYPHSIANEGVSGHTSTDGLALLPSTLNNHADARYYLIQYGTNDARIPVPSGLGLQPGNPSYPGTFKDNMQKIITIVTAMGKIPYVAKVPKAFGSSTALNPYLQAYNQVIDELVAANHIGVIPPDFYCFFESNPAQMADDLHPNGTGYQAMANLWRDALTDQYSGGCY